MELSNQVDHDMDDSRDSPSDKNDGSFGSNEERKGTAGTTKGILGHGKRTYNEMNAGKPERHHKSDHGGHDRNLDLDARPVGNSSFEIKSHPAKQFEGILRSKKDLYHILAHEGKFRLLAE